MENLLSEAFGNFGIVPITKVVKLVLCVKWLQRKLSGNGDLCVNIVSKAVVKLLVRIVNIVAYPKKQSH